jgi:hypothetical protein
VVEEDEEDSVVEVDDRGAIKRDREDQAWEPRWPVP